MTQVRYRFSTFGTISTSGEVTDRFGVGNDFDALTFTIQNVGYGPDLFYFLRHDGSAPSSPQPAGAGDVHAVLDEPRS